MTAEKKSKKLLQLFLTFFKIGLFTFGGGYAMIAVIEDICVERKKWITHEDMLNVTVIAESTPGPIAINCATFVGYKQCGILGAIVATLGVILPSFAIIFIISQLLDNFLKYRIVANAFKGIKIAVGIMIVDAAIKLFKKTEKDILSVIIAAASFIAVMLINIFSLSFSTIYLLLIAGLVGFIAYMISSIRHKGDLKK